MERTDYLNPYLIAEIGVNHEGDFEKAKHMIDLAATSGCNAVKFQIYKAEGIASKRFSDAYWDVNEETTRSQYELFKKYDSLTNDEYRELAIYTHQRYGIDFIVTPFDSNAVELAEEIADIIKIASADITNLPLLKTCAKTRKPMILSTGASTIEEIDNAVNTLEKEGGHLVALLHCVLNYPLNYENVQMKFLDTLKEKYSKQYKIGYSDHTKPTEEGELEALFFATLKGAEILEKHFTYNKFIPGNDHYHSMTAEMVVKFRRKIFKYQSMNGDRNLKVEEAAIKNARRRIFAKKKIEAGSTIREDDLIPLRASCGLEINQWDEVIGKKTIRTIHAGEYLSIQDIF